MMDPSSPVKRKQASIRFTQTPLLAALQSDNPSEHLFPYLSKKPGSSYNISANPAYPTDKLRHSSQRSISEFISPEISPSAYKQGGFFQTEVNIKPKTSKTEEIKYAYYSTNRLQLEKKPYDRKVGPGYYSLPNAKSTPSFSFPITGRFESDKIEKMNCYFKRISITTITPKSSEVDKIELNKILTDYKPDKRKDLIRYRSLKTNEKIREIKIKRQASQISARTEKITKFNEKMRKYELRLRKREINEVTACWGVMSVIFLCSIHIHNLIQYRINLHSRSHRLHVRLTVFMRALGKFLKIKSRMRTRISSAIINKFYGSIRLWVQKRRDHHLEVILEVTENSAASNFMFRMMAKWFSKIIFIQRKLRASLQYIKIRNSILRMNWNRVEAQLYQNAIKKRKLLINIEPSLLQGIYTIPNFVKEYYIRSKLKQRVRDHMRDMYLYRQQCSAILSISNSNEDGYYYKGKPELPPKPVSRYYITKEEYKYMILDALKNRLKWEHNPSAYMK